MTHEDALLIDAVITFSFTWLMGFITGWIVCSKK